MTHLRFDTEQDWIAALTVEWQRLGSEAVQKRGVFNVALTGGATSAAFYRALSRADWAWSATRLFIGDERWVPAVHRDSNYHMIYESFYPLALNLERWKTELPKAEDAAADYERRLIRDLGQPPRFDLVLLGVGADGHTASLFSGTRALTVRDQFAVANWVPQLGAQRLTLTYATLHQAKAIWFLTSGAEPQPWLQRMEQGTSSDFPAATVTTERGEVKIFNCTK